MLLGLLRMVASGDVHSFCELAQQLGVSEKLVEAMVGELTRMGYLKPADVGCNGDCSHCPMGGSCAVGSLGRVWVLTKNGHRMTQADPS